MRTLTLILAAAVTLPIFAQETRVSAGPTPAQAAAAAQPAYDNTWWKHAAIYEIYPRSFKDSNGDGIGDLNGITSRLDYLQQLGIDAIWIAPMYPSPQVDFGYDISNYTGIDPQYGTLANFDHLLATAKAHHIRILLDMVLNHTSDQHPWFLDSASSRTNPHADWYCWSDGISIDAAGVTAYQRRWQQQTAHGILVPPNNWTSLFGGSAWQWVPARQQFYYHKFYRQQPDLNWRNPAVEKAMFDAMRFWLDRGVAGFRLDAITTLFEDPQLRNEPVASPGVNAQGDPNLSDIYTDDLPEVHGVIRRMRQMADSYAPTAYPGSRVLIGETYLPNTATLAQWYGTTDHPELQLPMDMLLGFHTEGGAPSGPNATLNVAHFRKYITEAETQLDGQTPLIVFDNHDNTRSWDRFTTADETFEQKQLIARLISTVLYTVHATALTYYGAELGMVTSTPTRREDVRDPIGITGWPREKGRDGERTPMQWTPGEQAGFSTDAQTWLPLAKDYKTVNVETESADPNSLLRWNQTLIAIRARNATMRSGGIVMLDNENPNVLSYVRTAPGNARPLLISLNMTAQPQTIRFNLTVAGIHTMHLKTLLADAASLNAADDAKSITLPPFASLVAEIEP